MEPPINKYSNNIKHPIDYYQLKLEEIEEIENAPDPEYLIGSIEEGNAFPIPKNGITVITAKSGGGKSLLSRAILQKFLDDPDTGIIYADYEFEKSVAKERKYSDFKKPIKEGRFTLLTQVNEENDWEVLIKGKLYRQYLDPEELEDFEKELKIIQQAKLSERQKIFLSVIYFYSHRFIDVIVVVDSLEDIIANSSDDKEVKKFLEFILKRPNITVIFNHHLRKAIKGEQITEQDIVRGSRVIVNKAKAVLFITDTTDEDDFTKSYEIKILKMRTKYLTGIDKVYVRVNTENYELTYHFNADREKIYILKQIYFTLKQYKELNTRELIEKVKEKARKSPNKINEVLKEYQSYFDITKHGRATIYRLPTGDKLFQLENLLGLEDKEYKQLVNSIAEFIPKIPPDWEKEITLKSGTVLKLNKKTIETNLHRWSKQWLNEIYYALAKEFLEVDVENFPDTLPDDWDDDLNLLLD